VFSVEVKFKVEGTEVTLQRFAELLLLEALRSAQEQLQLSNVAVAPAPTAAKETTSNRAPEPKVVSIHEAARLVGLRPSTIRKYVAIRKITFVRIGRRVLIPNGKIPTWSGSSVLFAANVWTMSSYGINAPCVGFYKAILSTISTPELI